jgi:hypothetical protein
MLFDIAEKSFLHLRDISQSFKLCCACLPSFCGVMGSESKGEMIWPPFVWNMFLGAGTLVVRSVIPKSWHGWWLGSVICDILVLKGVMLDYPVSLVVKEVVSIETKELSDALQKLQWKELEEIPIRLCCVPQVRCPWGCTEFYHKANDLPQDYFIKAILDCNDMKGYSPGSQGQWTRGMRQDVLLS